MSFCYATNMITPCDKRWGTDYAVSGQQLMMCSVMLGNFVFTKTCFDISAPISSLSSQSSRTAEATSSKSWTSRSCPRRCAGRRSRSDASSSARSTSAPAASSARTPARATAAGRSSFPAWIISAQCRSWSASCRSVRRTAGWSRPRASTRASRLTCLGLRRTWCRESDTVLMFVPSLSLWLSSSLFYHRSSSDTLCFFWNGNSVQYPLCKMHSLWQVRILKLINWVEERENSLNKNPSGIHYTLILRVQGTNYRCECVSEKRRLGTGRYLMRIGLYLWRPLHTGLMIQWYNRSSYLVWGNLGYTATLI